MSRPPDNVIKLGLDTLTLCEYTSGGNKGFWLYDKTRGMNLGMRAKTAEDAFLECIKYYQKRLAEVENNHKVLSSKVQAFVSQFIEEPQEEHY